MVVESQPDAAPTRWVFIPSKYRDDCRWIEVGRDVTTGADGTTVRLDRPYLTDLMVESEELHLYHFHPLSYFQRCPPKVVCDLRGLPWRSG